MEEKGKQTAGEKQGRKPWTLREFGGKTLWDWLHLLSALAIPVVLAAAGLWFTAQQDRNQGSLERQLAQQAQKIENQRAEAERALAKERAQDEALQAYLSQMGSLLLEKDLRKSAKDSEVRSLARARTLTVLGRLDSGRKEKLLQFLYEAELIQKANPVIDLTGADLQGIDLSNDRLSGGPFLANYLEELERLGARPLEGAPASDSEFGSSPADLSGASLRDADLSSAWLDGVDLSGADLASAGLYHTDLNGAILSGAILNEAELKGADLSGADLRSALLGEANLRNASLSKAILSKAILSDASLFRADLSDAYGYTQKQLAQAGALKGATMPNGQKYEDWLKDKKAQGKEEKNEGSP
jgi:uncharacterized protein YjbI with pentapeptide repeats